MEDDRQRLSNDAVVSGLHANYAGVTRLPGGAYVDNKGRVVATTWGDQVIHSPVFDQPEQTMPAGCDPEVLERPYLTLPTIWIRLEAILMAGVIAFVVGNPGDVHPTLPDGTQFRFPGFGFGVGIWLAVFIVFGGFGWRLLFKVPVLGSMVNPLASAVLCAIALDLAPSMIWLGLGLFFLSLPLRAVWMLDPTARSRVAVALDAVVLAVCVGLVWMPKSWSGVGTGLYEFTALKKQALDCQPVIGAGKPYVNTIHCIRIRKEAREAGTTAS